MADPKPISSDKADSVNLRMVTEVYSKYGTIIPYSDGRFEIVLPIGSPLAAKLTHFMADPRGQYQLYSDKDGRPTNDPTKATPNSGFRSNASAAEYAELDNAMGKKTTPDIDYKTDSKGRVILTIPQAELDKFTQYDLQRGFDGMLDYFKIPKRVSSLEQLPAKVADAAREAAGSNQLAAAEPKGAPEGNRVARNGQAPTVVRQA